MVQRWHGKHIFDRLGAKQLEGGLAGIAENPLATHFYVDPQDGLDANGGTTFDDAKLTLQAAIDLCTDWKGDIIHVTRGTQSVSTSVLFNKKGITVIADLSGNPAARGESHMIYGTHTDGPAGTITAPCILSGLGFTCTDADGPALLIDGTLGGFSGGFNLIHECRFTTWQILQGFGLRMFGGGLNIIEGCIFDGLYNPPDPGAWTGYATSPISGYGPFDTIIRDNKFMNTGPNSKYCIQWESGSIPLAVVIERNFNFGPQKFFNNNGVTNYQCLLVDNYVNGLTGTESYDDTVTNLIAKGVEFMNNHYHEE